MRKSRSKPAIALRKQAERTLKGKKLSFSTQLQDVRRLVHQFRAHQVELEMQDEEFRCLHAEVEESRNRYAALFEHAPMNYLVIDRNGMIKEANVAACKMLGEQKHALLKTKVLRFLPAESRRLFLSFIARIEKTRRKQTCELELACGKGRKMFVHAEGSTYPAAKSRSVQLLISLVDITERKRAEDALKTAEAQYRSLTENSPDLIARFDRQFRHLYVNPAAAKAGHYSPEGYVGKTMCDVGVPDQARGRSKGACAWPLEPPFWRSTSTRMG